MKKYVFEVETYYKSGYKKTDCIAADSEREMWTLFDKCHDNKKIEYSTIVDCWIQ